MSDDYAELVRAAKDALGDMLRASEPGTGLSLHMAYAALKSMLDKEQGTVVETQQESPEKKLAREFAEAQARTRLWLDLNLDDRHRIILQVIGDEKLTLREITKRLDDYRDDWKIWQSNVASTVKRLCERGDLACEKDMLGNRPRNRYFHSTDLTGTIADLEREFGDAETA
jgi:hypothetical protein